MNEPPVPTDLPAAPGAGAGGHLRVLVVDDEADARGFLRLELEQAGFAVRTAASGEEALATIMADRPDVVLLDVRMPGIDGFQTCEVLRRQDLELPVIFMTGLGETEHILKGFQAGGTDYVTKPVTAAVVVARILAHGRTARMMRATREAIDSSDQLMLAFDSDSRVLWVNEALEKMARGLGTQDPVLAQMPLPPWLTPLEELWRDGGMVSFQAGPMSLLAQRLDEPNAAVCVARLEPVVDARARPRPVVRMTARESEVLLWVTRGKTNRDIAEIIGVSPRTVNKHLEHIFEKLGVETRTAAAAIGSKMDLGDSPSSPSVPTSPGDARRPHRS